MRTMGKGSRHEGIERYEGDKGATWTARASKRLPTGQRIHWRDTFSTESAAVKARRAWLADQEGAYAIAPTRLTLADAARTWLATYPQTCAPKTALEYARTVRVHILPAPIAATPLARLHAGQIQDWYNGLAVGPCTKLRIHQRLCQILALAVAQKRLRDNPARTCAVPRYTPRRGTLLTDDQIAAFLDVARADFFHPFWDVALATGFRRGEVLGLRWRDVDLERGLLTVRHTVIWMDRPEAQERTKTPASVRTVKVAEDVVALLRCHAARMSIVRAYATQRGTWQEHDLVFCTRYGNPLGANNIHKHFKALLAMAGLPKTIKIHDLRHSNLSFLLNSGVPLSTVARRGGYRNPGVLLATYLHADAAQDAHAADVAGALTSRSAQQARLRTVENV